MTGSFAVVAGGDQNTASAKYSAIGGGQYNYNSGNWSVIGGGIYNNASMQTSTIAGGQDNAASANWATVGGGTNNVANGSGATVVGGVNSTASGQDSVVAGGEGNQAGGDDSFAGGTVAHVRSAAEVGGSNTTGDQGTFIWADDNAIPQNFSGPACPDYPIVPTCTLTQVPTLTSTGPNQFLVRAAGGFALNDVPVNAKVAMTIQAPTGNPGYADVFMHQAGNGAGILLGAGDAGSAKANNASFYIDQYNGSAQTRRLSLDAGGNLTVSAQAYKPGGGSWAASSDGRLKKNVQPLDHALDRLLALRGVTFEYSRTDSTMHPAGTFTGFIAQEVQQTFPNWIGHDAQGYLTVGPQGFEALTVEALREIKKDDDARIARLEAENAKMRAQIADQLRSQEETLAELRKQVAALTSVQAKDSSVALAASERTGN